MPGFPDRTPVFVNPVPVTANVPVVMAAGDLGFIKQVQEFFPGVVCASFKEGIGKAAKMLHPTKAQEMFKKKTKEALTNLKKFKHLKLKTPITMEIRYKEENDAFRGSWLPGAKRTGERTVAYTHNDLMEVLKFFIFAH